MSKSTLSPESARYWYVDQGLNQIQTAKALGTTRMVVRRLLILAGVKSRPSGTQRGRIDMLYTVDADGCWLWNGSTDRLGYGHTARKGSALAHRWMWEHLNGPVPAGLELDHLCRVRKCVNPAHLEPVTHQENMRRSHEARRRVRAA